MLATFAFDVCHDVYLAAREAIDSKISTINLESSGKYTWHPDRMPRLAEYVCDFARAGERALVPKSEVSSAGSPPAARRASRMAMFRVYYLGGAEYASARRHLGISELTWADWATEVRTRVGHELTRSGVFPPSKYFRCASAEKNENSGAFATRQRSNPDEVGLVLANGAITRTVGADFLGNSGVRGGSTRGFLTQTREANYRRVRKRK